MIAWVREHAVEYGADPSLLVVAGSSAGAHLASMAALTANDPVFQPGFEHADTSVSAAVCLYGFYGNRDLAGPVPSSPHAYVRRDAPPFFVAHGDNDTRIPAARAQSFVDALRSVSMNPVVYAQTTRSPALLRPVALGPLPARDPRHRDVHGLGPGSLRPGRRPEHHRLGP